MILELFLLVYAHCIGDMVLQTGFISKYKGSSVLAMLSHITLYTGTITVALLILGLYADWKLILIFFGHLMIDLWKSRVPKDKEHWNCLYYDQAIHLAQIVVVWLL